MPVGVLRTLVDDRQVSMPTSQIFDGRRVVLFSCPGAFTTKSTVRQVPSFRDRADEFRALGVDAIVCISVNDPWVMQAWATHCDVDGRIEMLGDPHCEYHTALGLQMDCLRLTLGWRSHRFSMFVEDGEVVELNVEEPGGYSASDGSVLIEQLRTRAQAGYDGRLPPRAAKTLIAGSLTPTERRNADRVLGWAAAYEMPGGSAARMVDEFYADAADVMSVLTGTVVARSDVSKQAWRDAEVALETRYRSRRLVLSAIYPCGDTVAVEGRTEQVLKDGTTVEWPFAVFLTFDADGRIARDRTYMLPVPHQAEFERAAAAVADHSR